MGFKLEDLLRAKPELLERRDRCTTGKTVFYSKAEARTEADRLNRTERTKMEPFRCGYCDRYHLGHRRGAIY